MGKTTMTNSSPCVTYLADLGRYTVTRIGKSGCRQSLFANGRWVVGCVQLLSLGDMLNLADSGVVGLADALDIYFAGVVDVL